MRFEFIGFGALNLDKLFKVNMIAKEEEEAFVTEFKECAGGSAANTVVGLARLAIKTGFVGKIASDREGEIILNELRTEGVDISGISISQINRSGTVMGYVDPNGDRALYVDPGVNDNLDSNDIERDYISGAEFLHLSSFVGEKPFNAQKHLIEALYGTRVCFDPGAIYARKGLTALKSIIHRSYSLFPNALEVKLLTGEDYEAGAKKLIELGAEIVAVKLGKDGCFVTDGKESHLIEAYKVEPVDTTGAGDAFNAGFIYGLIKRKDLYYCGQLGNFVASRCVSAMGSRNGLPRLADLKTF
jgi:ribokinase